MQKEPPLILVTGITGHSGRWFAERLVREGYADPIRCTLRATSDASFLAKTRLNYSTVVGDITNPAFLDRITKGVDTILHIANIHFSERIVEAAIRNGVKWVILVHTTGRYSRFNSASAEYIRIEDRILGLKSNIALTVLRPTMIYGSSRDQNMCRLIDYLYRHKFFPIFGSGNNLMQPVHARDLGNAYYDVLVNPEITINHAYNLPGKEPIRYIDLVRTISRALGRKNIIVTVPMWLSLLAARLFTAVSRKSPISVEQVMRMKEDKDFDYGKAAQDFRYSPVSFPEGIASEVEEYLQKSSGPR